MHRPNWKQQLLQLAATNRLHHRPPCSLNNEYLIISKCENWKNNYKEYLMPPKMPKYAEKICDIRTLLKYAKNAAKCQICGNRIFAFF